MAVLPEPTPNPNAMKFTVGRDVGEARTFAAGEPHDDPLADDLLGVVGVTSIFMTADFVTVTKADAASWDEIEPEAVAVLERHFD